MTVPEPTATTRWRCTACGNLTRFDVTRSSRVIEYVHLDLAGHPAIEDRTVLAETLEHVRCRWCDTVDSVELIPRTDAGAQVTGRTVEEAAAVEERAVVGREPPQRP